MRVCLGQLVAGVPVGFSPWGCPVLEGCLSSPGDTVLPVSLSSPGLQWPAPSCFQPLTLLAGGAWWTLGEHLRGRGFELPAHPGF